jgi:hypothetical protein
MTFEGNHQVRCIRLDEKGDLPKPDKAGSNV